MLTGFKNILYVSDLEKGSRPAFRAAVGLGEQYQGKITYLHVVEAVSDTAKGVLTHMMSKQEVEKMLAEGIDRVRDKAKKRIKKFCDEELKDKYQLTDEQVKILVKEGQPWKVILKTAKKIDADVVVMGTRKNSRLGKLFLGSTASKVIGEINRPVLIVPLEKKAK